MMVPVALPLPSVLGTSIVGRFKSYLFRPGGAYTVAICRVGLFGYLYVHVYAGVVENGLADSDYYSKVNIAAYHAKSVLYLLFPNNPPPIEFVHIVLSIAAVSTLCATMGILTRISMIVSVTTLTFLVALIYAWEPLWSHPYNSGLLAGIGFMFGRAGDVLSVDSLAARYILRRPIAINRRVYSWPVILGLFGTAALYFGGFYAKWSTTEWTYDFSWVFTDNLRNAASLPWLIYGRELPWQVDLLVNTPWLWKLAAFGHLAMQLLPMLAMFSLNRPFVRLAEGFIFILGVALLKMVMGFWNPEWMILAVFFVDWEYFLKKAGAPLASMEPARPVQHPWPIMANALAFMALNLIIIAVRYDDRGSSRLYPFSSMNFYSNVAASKPYTEHKFYPFVYGQLELEYAGHAPRQWHCFAGINALYLSAFVNAPAQTKLPRQVGAIQSVVNAVTSYQGEEGSDCEGTVNTADYRAIDLYASILDIPPHPERVRFEIGFRALVGRYERDRDRVIAAAGGVRAIGSTVFVDVQSQGLDVARYDILLANDPWRNDPTGPLIEPEGAWKSQTFEFSSAFYRSMAAGVYPVVVRVTEKSGAAYDFYGGHLYR
jgi:hypothetical protein